ncbi:snf 1 [Rickenella mellea]|uniref:non-specific serine/threonine protein kinase n=1 Tax=Rickenella mellea TaxID=50990 RepID=A0A4Y7QHW9_9AGAM|nr:snf 1 [Rickenella mellea]
MSDHPHVESHSPSKLGEYRVIGDIATGTYGNVKLGEHTITGQKVAMKYISKDMIGSTHTKARVQKEVQFMRTLQHPHIIKLYEAISTPTDIIIVLELAKLELFDYIVENGRLREPDARRFFQQIMAAIDYSHHRGIVHRDLKPENILLDDDFNIKITDFGLSNEVRDGAFLRTSCGSPNYAAPEVIKIDGLYDGKAADVWSCGVILFVLLAGRLPFDSEDTNVLFERIKRGHYQIPDYLSPEAKSLIAGMLHIDPTKRLTVSEVMTHPWFTPGLARYLTPLPPPPGPVLGTLSSLVAPPQELDFEVIEGLGRMEEDAVKELADRMEGVSIDEVWEALRREDGIQGNAVKVAYMLLRDKRRQGKDLSQFADQEREAQIAAMDPRNLLSPSALSPTGNLDTEENPFEVYEDGEGEDESNGVLGFSAQPTENNFAVLNSSLIGPQQHHLALFASAKRNNLPDPKEKKRTRWHFGIRSRSSPMEVMSALYASLKALGMEWKEKPNLGGLCEGSSEPNGRRAGERTTTNHPPRSINFDAAGDIYLIESRARYQDVVVLMNIKLYYVQNDNYLVDFHHVTSYRASTEPGAGKFDTDKPLSRSDSSSDTGSILPQDYHPKEEVLYSPYAFMDVATKLILELAGGSV